MTTRQQITARVRCKAFSSEGVRINKVRIEQDGSLLVWDTVAGHYTSCHAILPQTAQRIRRKVYASN